MASPEQPVAAANRRCPPCTRLPPSHPPLCLPLPREQETEGEGDSVTKLHEDLSGERSGREGGGQGAGRGQRGQAQPSAAHELCSGSAAPTRPRQQRRASAAHSTCVPPSCCPFLRRRQHHAARAAPPRRAAARGALRLHGEAGGRCWPWWGGRAGPSCACVPSPPVSAPSAYCTSPALIAVMSPAVDPPPPPCLEPAFAAVRPKAIPWVLRRRRRVGPGAAPGPPPAASLPGGCRRR